MTYVTSNSMAVFTYRHSEYVIEPHLMVWSVLRLWRIIFYTAFNCLSWRLSMNNSNLIIFVQISLNLWFASPLIVKVDVKWISTKISLFETNPNYHRKRSIYIHYVQSWSLCGWQGLTCRPHVGPMYLAIRDILATQFVYCQHGFVCQA